MIDPSHTLLGSAVPSCAAWRKEEIQRLHLACVFLAWHFLFHFWFLQLTWQPSTAIPNPSRRQSIYTKVPRDMAKPCLFFLLLATFYFSTLPCKCNAQLTQSYLYLSSYSIAMVGDGLLKLPAEISCYMLTNGLCWQVTIWKRSNLRKLHKGQRYCIERSPHFLVFQLPVWVLGIAHNQEWCKGCCGKWKACQDLYVFI